MPKRRFLRFSLLVCATAILVLAQALPAQACSCFPEDPRDEYARADGAFIGTYVGRHALTEDTEFGDYAYTFEVDEEFKGDLPETIDVISASNGAACGLEVQEGQQIGLLLEMAEDGWRSNLCRQESPENLRRVAEPLPEPNGTPPAAFLVGGSFGEARVISLDSEGRILGYGYDGNYDVIHLSMCPGGQRSIELYRSQFAGLRYAVRDVDTLQVLRDGVFTTESYRFSPIVFCRDAEAKKVFGFVTMYEGPARVLKLGKPNKTIHKGKVRAVGFGGDRVYLREGKRALIAIDLDSRKQVVAARGQGSAPLSVSPDGMRVAWVIPRSQTGEGRQTSSVYLLETGGGAPALHEASLGESYTGQALVWAGPDRVVLTCGPDASIRTYDSQLQELGSAVGSCPYVSSTVGDTLWSIDYEARLVRLILPSGSEEIVLELPSPTAFTISSV